MRILSYNILNGGEARLPLILEVIRHQQPDAVALLEANVRANAEQLAQALGMSLVFGEANSAYHVAWLTRLPVLQETNHRLPPLHKTLLQVTVALAGQPLHLFATHLLAGNEPGREEHRVGEIRAILDVLRPLASTPHLLVGDLNALHPGDRAAGDAVGGGPAEQAPVAESAIALLLAAGYSDCYRLLHPTLPGHTIPTSLVEGNSARIDYAFASPALAPHVAGCDVVREGAAKQASDHFPVWVELR